MADQRTLVDMYEEFYKLFKTLDFNNMELVIPQILAFDIDRFSGLFSTVMINFIINKPDKTFLYVTLLEAVHNKSSFVSLFLLKEIFSIFDSPPADLISREAQIIQLLRFVGNLVNSSIVSADLALELFEEMVCHPRTTDFTVEASIRFIESCQYSMGSCSLKQVVSGLRYVYAFHRDLLSRSNKILIKKKLKSFKRLRMGKGGRLDELRALKKKTKQVCFKGMKEFDLDERSARKIHRSRAIKRIFDNDLVRNNRIDIVNLSFSWIVRIRDIIKSKHDTSEVVKAVNDICYKSPMDRRSCVVALIRCLLDMPQGFEAFVREVICQICKIPYYSEVIQTLFQELCDGSMETPWSALDLNALAHLFSHLFTTSCIAYDMLLCLRVSPDMNSASLRFVISLFQNMKMLLNQREISILLQRFVQGGDSQFCRDLFEDHVFE